MPVRTGLTPPNSHSAPPGICHDRKAAPVGGLVEEMFEKKIRFYVLVRNYSSFSTCYMMHDFVVNLGVLTTSRNRPAISWNRT